MNGKAAKRIRIAARVMSPKGSPERLRALYKALKRSYRDLPYHRRDTPTVEAHSEVLRRHHQGDRQ